jgi:cytochrome c oxidase assembly protein subunit 15
VLTDGAETTEKVRGWPKLAAFSALLPAIAVMPLVFSGAAVTSYGVGMAVADWPSTNGENMFLYNMLNDSFGVKVEHGHRLIGAAVGLLAILHVVVSCCTRRPRRAVIALAIAGLVAVCIQGLFGGLRVVLNDLFGTGFASIHAVFAQLTFALLWVSAWVAWRDGRGPTPVHHELAGSARGITLALAIGMLIQLVLGVAHRQLAMTFIPHAVFAGVLLIGFLYLAAMMIPDGELRRVAGRMLPTLLLLFGLQIGLGIVSALMTGLVPGRIRTGVTHTDAVIRAAHVVVGALLFAGSVLLAARCRLALRPVSAEADVARPSATLTAGGVA